jgi:hypothetical protein
MLSLHAIDAVEMYLQGSSETKAQTSNVPQMAQ